MNLESIFLVGAGGFLGAIARYLLNVGVEQLLPSTTVFPYGVVAINVAGCLTMMSMTSSPLKRPVSPRKVFSPSS